MALISEADWEATALEVLAEQGWAPTTGAQLAEERSSLADLLTGLRAAYQSEALAAPPIIAALRTMVGDWGNYEPAIGPDLDAPQPLTRRERE